jgi:hypothetical protein
MGAVQAEGSLWPLSISRSLFFCVPFMDVTFIRCWAFAREGGSGKRVARARYRGRGRLVGGLAGALHVGLVGSRGEAEGQRRQ